MAIAGRRKVQRYIFTASITLVVLLLYGLLTAPTSPKHVRLRNVRAKLTEWFYLVFRNVENCHLEQHEDVNTYISIEIRGRIGNHLFQYAALLAIAKAHRRIPVLSEKFFELKDSFHISMEPCHWKAENPRDFAEIITNVDASLKKMKQLPKSNITLIGYFQSYHYFETVKDQLREELTFKDHIAENAIRIIETAIPRKWASSPFTRVGVHVRRGDLLLKQFLDMGFVDISLEYFYRAMHYFQAKHLRVQFIVGSDDTHWCEQHLRETGNDMVDFHFLKGNAPIEDMAVLTMCDHVIITQGTFSWWVGWLVRGTTIYPKEYPPEGKLTSSMHQPKYYFPKDEHNHWVAI